MAMYVTTPSGPEAQKDMAVGLRFSPRFFVQDPVARAWLITNVIGLAVTVAYRFNVFYFALYYLLYAVIITVAQLRELLRPSNINAVHDELYVDGKLTRTASPACSRFFFLFWFGVPLVMLITVSPVALIILATSGIAIKIEAVLVVVLCALVSGYKGAMLYEELYDATPDAKKTVTKSDIQRVVASLLAPYVRVGIIVNALFFITIAFAPWVMVLCVLLIDLVIYSMEHQPDAFVLPEIRNG